MSNTDELRAAMAQPAAPVVERADSATPVVERGAGNVSNYAATVAPARWYCLSREGMATLCTDEEDAKEVAAESWVAWPHNGPYRVAQMVDAGQVAAAVAAERERRTQLATDFQEYLYRIAAQAPFEHAQWAQERGAALLAALRA